MTTDTIANDLQRIEHQLAELSRQRVELVDRKDDIEGQLAGYGDHLTDDDFEKWRRSATAAKHHTERELRTVNLTIRDLNIRRDQVRRRLQAQTAGLQVIDLDEVQDVTIDGSRVEISGAKLNGRMLLLRMPRELFDELRGMVADAERDLA